MLIQIATVEELKQALEQMEKAYAEVGAEEDTAEKRYAELFTKSEKLRKQRKTGSSVAEVEADMSDAYAALKRIRKERMAAYRVLKGVQDALDEAERAA